MHSGNLPWQEVSGPSEDVYSWCEGGGDGHSSEGDLEWLPTASNWKKTAQFIVRSIKWKKKVR